MCLIIGIMQDNWNEICDKAQLSTVEKNYFWKRQFLNPDVFHDSHLNNYRIQ